MKKLIFSCIAMLCIAIFGFTGCGPSKADKEAAARADSIRRADSIANLEKEKEKIKQQLLDSIQNAQEAQKEAELKALKPVTQYCIVTPTDFGANIRDSKQLKSLLKGLGFEVKTFNRPESMDEMDDFTELKASRKGVDGTTTISYITGEDRVVYIDFANGHELNQFVESMVVSNYSKSGNKYLNPHNNVSKVGVRVSGNKVKVIDPFEMLPPDFDF